MITTRTVRNMSQHSEILRRTAEELNEAGYKDLAIKTLLASAEVLAVGRALNERLGAYARSAMGE